MSFPKWFSASMVTEWLTCPMCWYVKHDKTSQLGEQKRETSGRMFFGRAISEALENLHTYYDINRAKDVFARSYYRHMELELPPIPSVDHGLALLDCYSESGVFKGIPEYKFLVPIKYNSGVDELPLPVMGYMDLLLANEMSGPYGIVEFKSSMVKWDQEKVDSELQGILYWCAFYCLFKKLPDFFYCIFRTDEVRVDIFEVKYSKELCLETLELLKRVFKEMEIAHSIDGVFPGFCSKHKDKRVLYNKDGTVKEKIKHPTFNI